MADINLGHKSQVLTGMSILIGGKTTFGFTGDGTKVSDVEFVEVDGQSIGIIKPLTMTIEVCNLNVNYITHIASNLPVVIKGNIHQDGANISYVVTLQGALKKMGKDVKIGDIVKRTFELNLNMYNEMVDGVPTINYTRHPYTCILGGVDTAPKYNQNI